MRTFCCLVYYRNTETRVDKFEPRAKAGVFFLDTHLELTATKFMTSKTESSSRRVMLNSLSPFSLLNKSKQKSMIGGNLNALWTMMKSLTHNQPKWNHVAADSVTDALDPVIEEPMVIGDIRC